MDINKIVEELDKYNLPSNADYFRYVDKEIKKAENLLQNMRDRVKYRFLENISYTGIEAENKTREILDLLNDAQKVLDKYFNIIG